MSCINRVVKFHFCKQSEISALCTGQRMNISSSNLQPTPPAETAANYNRVKELKDFDDTKAGVKGLVDAGIMNIPKIFVRPSDELAGDELNACSLRQLQVPIIDLNGIDRGNPQRKAIVDQVNHASKKWGFFQVVNHGISVSVMNQMIDGVRLFHEQDLEVKKEYYSHDRKKNVRYDSSINLYQSRFAKWRDTLNVSLLVPGHFDPDELPPVCRDAILEYINDATKLGNTLFELLSEALGLKTDHLRAMECVSGRKFVGHYYPPCPEPELTLGANKHTDPSFLTIVLQDNIGGLQFLHENRWIDVPPLVGALVVNIGDLLQIISNKKFTSVDHRVLANRVGPRISVASFFTGVVEPEKIYCPIKELISKESPAIYREYVVSDYIKKFYSRSQDMSGVDHFRL